MSYQLTNQFLNVGYYLGKVRAAREYSPDSQFFKFGYILFGNNTADNNGDIIHTLGFHLLLYCPANRQMSA